MLILCLISSRWTATLASFLLVFFFYLVPHYAMSEEKGHPKKKARTATKQQSVLGMYGFQVIKQDAKNPKKMTVTPVPRWRHQ